MRDSTPGFHVVNSAPSLAFRDIRSMHPLGEIFAHPLLFPAVSLFLNLHSSCAFFVKVDYFRFARELPIRRARARTRSRTKARHCVILRLAKYPSVPGPTN